MIVIILLISDNSPSAVPDLVVTVKVTGTLFPVVDSSLIIMTLTSPVLSETVVNAG